MKHLTVADYVKITEMKGFLVEHLSVMGLKEQVRTIEDEDLEKLMYMMGLLGDQLKGKDTDEERVEMLISYVICMWVRLIVDYGAGIDEL